MQNKEIAILDKISEEMKTLSGHLGFYYKNLVTGTEYGVGEEEIYDAASVIKLPLFLHVLAQCEEGKMSLDDPIVTEESDKVPGCGALKMFAGAVESDVRALCKLMICISDNTATNRLIRHFGLEDVEKGFVAMGLEKTKIRRFLYDHRESLRGVRNTISPKELGILLEKLYRGEFVNQEVSKYAIEVLSGQQVCHKLEGKINEEVCVAHKTGEDYMLSNDVGIVYAKNPFVVCFAGHDTDVYYWEDLIRRAAYDLYKVWED